MRRRPCLPGLFSLVVCSLLSFTSVFADTIVLKNGRHILAVNAVEIGDQVRYETPAGTLAIPKSIVDHIEKGIGSFSEGTGGPGAAQLSISPPAMESGGGGDIERGTVHDGAIDRDFIAGLENEARAGSKEANENAALAHHVAAQFEVSHGDLEDALTDERTALIYEPDQPVLLMNMAYLHLRRSEYGKSLDYLERARQADPNNPDEAKLAGWAYYGLNKIDQAVAEWKRALSLRPDPEVDAALAKAMRDKQEEASYKENESTHFTLRYSGDAQPQLAREVLRTLETHYSEIESELDYSPPDPIGVILYTQQAFEDITRAPGWVGALNDGRIRVPVQGLTSVTPELSRVLKHELTHSFVGQKTHGRAPTWLQEGLAQWMEGKRSGENAATLLQVYDAKQNPSLVQLEGTWMNFSNDTAEYAYAWALANVEYIIESGGMGDIEKILDHIAQGESTEATLREVIHEDYGDLMQSTADYLRKTYQN
jgi:tetratricopeptide (TPR) repeat protein